MSEVSAFERILAIASRELPAAGVECLLIGGLAVNEYGYSRMTLDVDFMVFALSQNTNRRMGKDLPDIAYLTVLNELDLARDIRPLCERFGTDDVYDLIRRQVEGLTAP